MRLSVTTKIFLGLAVVVLTFGLVSIFSVVQLHTIGRDLELVSHAYLPLTRITAELESAHQNRARDTARLIEDEAAPGVQALMIKILRTQIPKSLQRVGAARARARSGRSIASDPRDAEVLAGIESRIDRLDALYTAYDQAAEALARSVAARDVGSGDAADVGPVLAELRRADRLLASELRDLSRALDREVTLQVRRAEAREDRAALAIVGLFLGAVFLGLSVTVFVQRTLRPIARLTEAVQEVQQGRFDRRVESPGQDEIGDLARAFNAMAQALEERARQLSSQREALLRAERLAAAGRIAAQVSHEIRNPLSSVGLNAELLGEELERAHFDDQTRAGEARALLAAIAKEVDRLTEITEEYLRFGRLPRPTLASEDVNEAVQGVVSFTAGEMAAARVGVSVTLDDSLPPVRADEGQLRQALLNLLRNAREALEAGGRIEVRTERRGDRARISITDDGPGIAVEDRDRIFDPFFSTKDHGTGLGLALTQQIVAEHGGSLSCAAAAPRGTCFTIELPLEPEGELGDGAEDPDVTRRAS